MVILAKICRDSLLRLLRVLYLLYLSRLFMNGIWLYCRTNHVKPQHVCCKGAFGKSPARVESNMKIPSRPNQLQPDSTKAPTRLRTPRKWMAREWHLSAAWCLTTRRGSPKPSTCRQHPIPVKLGLVQHPEDSLKPVVAVRRLNSVGDLNNPKTPPKNPHQIIHFTGTHPAPGSQVHVQTQDQLANRVVQNRNYTPEV